MQTAETTGLSVSDAQQPKGLIERIRNGWGALTTRKPQASLIPNVPKQPGYFPPSMQAVEYSGRLVDIKMKATERGRLAELHMENVFETIRVWGPVGEHLHQELLRASKDNQTLNISLKGEREWEPYEDGEAILLSEIHHPELTAEPQLEAAHPQSLTFLETAEVLGLGKNGCTLSPAEKQEALALLEKQLLTGPLESSFLGDRYLHDSIATTGFLLHVAPAVVEGNPDGVSLQFAGEGRCFHLAEGKASSQVMELWAKSKQDNKPCFVTIDIGSRLETSHFTRLRAKSASAADIGNCIDNYGNFRLKQFNPRWGTPERIPVQPETERAEYGRKRLPLDAVVNARSERKQQQNQEPQPPTVTPERLAIKGYIAKEPQLRHAPDGTPYLRIHVGANEILSDGKPKRPDADLWHSAVIYGKQAQALKAHPVGTLVALAGDRVLTQRESAGKTIVLSSIVNPTIELLPTQKSVSIEATGTVTLPPNIQYNADGVPFVKALIAADQVKIAELSKDISQSVNRWHSAVFTGADAFAFAAEASQGCRLKVAGDHTTVAWSQDGERFTSSEIRNPTFTVLAQAKTVTPSRCRGEELSR